ncbi:MAG: TPM domain-containing protein [Deltaproteobacteria bacterium]|nr:TPM domain-containing protein [Deltaproteobacteria bacterium]
MKVEKFLTKEDKDLISKVVSEVEKTTTGEIVPMVVGASDTYPAASWRIAIVFALLLTSFFYLLFPFLDILVYLLFEIPAIFLGHFLVQVPGLKRWFLTRNEVDQEVLQRAMQGFLDNNLHATEQRNGVLIFVSLLEHRVHILADKGVNDVVPPGTWDEIVMNLINHIRKNEVQEGFCKAIEACGEILKKHFPKTKENQNELSNKLVVE